MFNSSYNLIVKFASTLHTTIICFDQTHEPDLRTILFKIWNKKWQRRDTKIDRKKKLLKNANFFFTFSAAQFYFNYIELFDSSKSLIVKFAWTLHTTLIGFRRTHEPDLKTKLIIRRQNCLKNGTNFHNRRQKKK